MSDGVESKAGTAGKKRAKAVDGLIAPEDGGAFDVALVGDLTIGGESGFRIAQEVAAFAASDFSSALIHLPSRSSRPVVTSDVQGCVRRGLAIPVDPAKALSANLLIVHGAHTISEMPAVLRSISAAHVVIVADRPGIPDLATIDRWFRSLFNTITWAPTNAWVRAALETHHPGLSIDPVNWGSAIVQPLQSRTRSDTAHRLTIGMLGGTDVDHWPANLTEMTQAYPTDGTFNVEFLGSPPASLGEHGEWVVLDPDAMSVGRFLSRLDALVYYPSATAALDLPDVAVAAMLAGGKPVLLPPALRSVYGSGPVYRAVREVAPMLRSYASDQVIRRTVRQTAIRAAKGLLGSSDRIGLTPLAKPKPKQKRSPGTPRTASNALFLATDESGSSQVTRLLAIARRATDLEPIFVTARPDIVEPFGFPAEYIPSWQSFGTDPSDWDSWFLAELERLIDAHDVRLVVYDGGAPSRSICRAVGSRGNCHLVWICAEDSIGPSSPSARYCDAVVQPRDLARGVASDDSEAETAFSVDPILLLDPTDLLPRAEAVKLLGLDPTKLSVLVQLEAGRGRDVVSVLDEVIRVLDRHKELQICIMEWSVSDNIPMIWPNAKLLKGYPVSQYYNAFDFALATPDYSRVNDAVNLELPTVFITNSQPSEAINLRRSGFAQENGLALEVSESDLTDLAAIVWTLLAEPARAFLRSNCRRFRSENGAAGVAKILANIMQEE